MSAILSGVSIDAGNKEFMQGIMKHTANIVVMLTHPQRVRSIERVRSYGSVHPDAGSRGSKLGWTPGYHSTYRANGLVLIAWMDRGTVYKYGRGTIGIHEHGTHERSTIQRMQDV